MKLSDVISSITSDNGYLFHVIDFQRLNPDVTVVTIEYWNRIGNTDKAVNHLKSYLALNLDKESETLYEDQTSVIGAVRTRKW